MPTEVATIVAGIVIIFVVFAAALMWATYYTRDVRAPGANYFDKAK